MKKKILTYRRSALEHLDDALAPLDGEHAPLTLVRHERAPFPQKRTSFAAGRRFRFPSFLAKRKEWSAGGGRAGASGAN